MKSENIKSEMYVLDHKIGVMIVNGMEYISLTDLARYKNKDTPGMLLSSG